MHYNVPQFIDVEDKVAGPLTAKQLLWMFGMGATLMMLWGLLDRTAFFLSAVPVAALFVALAFYKPHGRPLISFVFYGILFLFRPKMYVWKREERVIKRSAMRSRHAQETSVPTPAPTLDDIRRMAGTLDRRE